MTDTFLVQMSGFLLLAFTAIASLDGLYLHLYKFKLYRHPQSLFEHKLHTLNAVLFPGSVFCLFTSWGVGLVLWAGVVLTLLTFAIELRDVWCEPESRAWQGGLTGFESFLHFAMGLLRCAFSCFILASRSSAAWNMNAVNADFANASSSNPWAVALNLPQWLEVAALAIVASGIGIAILHIVLIFVGHQQVKLFSGSGVSTQ